MTVSKTILRHKTYGNAASLNVSGSGIQTPLNKATSHWNDTTNPIHNPWRDGDVIFVSKLFPIPIITCADRVINIAPRRYLQAGGGPFQWITKQYPNNYHKEWDECHLSMRILTITTAKTISTCLSCTYLRANKTRAITTHTPPKTPKTKPCIYQYTFGEQ